MTNVSLDKLLTGLGAEIAPLDGRRARWEIQAHWREAFAPEWHDWSGALNERDWHVFSYGHARHLEGAAAIEAFEEAKMSEPLIVADSLASGAMFLVRFSEVPAYLVLRNVWLEDLYIFPERFGWTLVLTHEDGLGPYFVHGPGEDQGPAAEI